MDDNYKQLTDALHRQLARQLHDEISGNLFALRVGLFNVMSALDPDQESLKLEIQKLKAITQSTLESVGEITDALRIDSD